MELSIPVKGTHYDFLLTSNNFYSQSLESVTSAAPPWSLRHSGLVGAGGRLQSLLLKIKFWEDTNLGTCQGNCWADGIDQQPYQPPADILLSPCDVKEKNITYCHVKEPLLQHLGPQMETQMALTAGEWPSHREHPSEWLQNHFYKVLLLVVLKDFQ